MKKKIDEASALLLYEAPSGIAIFSFDAAYLKNPVKDFWSGLPQRTLEFFLKYERVPTPFDVDNGTIDNFLAKRLTKLCSPKMKLAVGGAEHNKRIIEAKLGINCLYVGVPDSEVIGCSLKNPDRTLLPEEKSETYKRNCLPSGKELIKFSCQYRFHTKPEMVKESIVVLPRLLHLIKSREMEHLKFLYILLEEFLILSGIGTNWSLIELATLLKTICYREASYKGRYPSKIFSPDELRKIELKSSRYKRSFSRIDVLSVYDDVISLDIAKDILSFKLDFFVEKAKGWSEQAELIILPTGSKIGKEGSTNVADRLNPIAEDNCSEVTLVNGKLDFSGERPQQDVKQTLTIFDEHPSMEKPNSNEEIYNGKDDHCLIPHKVQEKLAANMDGVERNMQSGDTDIQSMDDYEEKLITSTLNLLGNKKDEHTDKQKDVIFATSAMPKSGPVKDLNGGGKKPTASTPCQLGKQNEYTETSYPVGDDKENKQSGDTGVQSMDDSGEKLTASKLGLLGNKDEHTDKQTDVIPATSEIPKSGPLKDLNVDEKKPTASTPCQLGKQNEYTDTSYPVGDDKENKQAGDTGVQSTDDSGEKLTASTLGLLGNKKDEHTDKQKDVIPDTSEIPKSGPLKDLNVDEKKPTTSTPGLLEKQNDTVTLVTLWMVLLSIGWSVVK